MIRFALAGIGGFGTVLARSIADASKHVDCKLVAAVRSRRPMFAEAGEKLAREGGELFDDAVEMFEKLRGRCDGVYITTSIESHMPLTLKAIECGYHMHLEKPPAATVQEVDTMSRALKESGRICLVGFQSVNGDEIRLLKDRIVSGRLGKVKNLICKACWPRGDAYYNRNSWAGKLRIGDAWVLDSPSMNAVAHQINNMLYLASDKPDRYAVPTAVRAELYAPPFIESHTTAAIEIQTDEGPTAYFIASHMTEEEFNPAFTIECEKGRAEYAMGEDNGSKITYADGTEESCPWDRKARINTVINLVEAMTNNDPSLIRCKIDDSRNMVLALDGAHESSGRVHRTPQEFLRRVDEGTEDARTAIKGLDEYIFAAAEKLCLFSDLDPAPPWAVHTESYDLSGYDEFPKQFRCD